MPSPRIAIATCTGYAGLKGDDDLLLEALRERGAEAVSVAWDERDVDWSGFDLCLVRSTWDYHEKYAEFLGWTRRVEAATVLRNPADLIAWNSDKRYLRELAEQGIRTVPTVWVGRGSDVELEAILAEQGWDEAVVKPVVDLGAKNLRRARRGEGSDALEAVLQRHDAMVQPFLPSLEGQGETSLIFIAGAFSHAVQKRPAAGDFRVQSIWGGTAISVDPDPRQLQLAKKALAILDETPIYARVDLVIGPDDRPCLIELELIEPNLYLSTAPAAAKRLADAVSASCRRGGG
jgi:glutathione synthase/RimK-type ligase-like ATP-grasp enzyme